MTDDLPKTFTERRRTRRVSATCRCWITRPGCALYAPVRDLSPLGLSVSGMAPFQPGEEVSVRIEGPHRGTDLVARSRVIWSRGLEAPAAMGLGAQFIEITAGEELLADLLDEGE